MKAALYCRVSTEEQAKSGYSLRQQIETLRRYCDAHDLEVVGNSRIGHPGPRWIDSDSMPCVTPSLPVASTWSSPRIGIGSPASQPTTTSSARTFSGHYVFVGDVDPNVVVDHGLSNGSKETAARRRLDFYRQAGLRVKVGQETEISLDIGGTSVCKSARAPDNTRSPKGTP
jgi:hypothetical protein